MSGSTITVSNSAELRKAFFAARGGETILLENNGAAYDLYTNAPYDYKNRPLNGTVTITSADPDDPAIFDHLVLKGANNLEFRDLVFGGVGSQHRVVDLSRDIQNVSFVDNEFRGWAEGRWTGHSSNGGSAVLVREADGFRFVGNTVENFALGLDVMNSANVEIEGNSFRYMQSDGLRMAQIQNGRVADNVMSDWLGVNTSVAHPDFIQLWSTNTTEPTRNLVIERNLLLANGEFSPQGIFLHNEKGLMYEGIAVRDNLIYNSHWNSIWVHTADGVDISGNVLVRAHAAAGSAGEAPRIRVFNSENVELNGNAASMLDVGGAWTGSGNATLSYADVRAADFGDAHLVAIATEWADDPLFARFLEAVGMAASGDAAQAPFGGATPTLVDVLALEAVEYDHGPRGVAYMDAPGLQGSTGASREGDVEQNAGGWVGNARAGEWLEYTIDVARAGPYDAIAMLAADGGGRAVRIDAYKLGEDVAYATTGEVAVASTGSGAVFGAVNFQDFALEAGEQSLRVTFLGGEQSFKSLTLDWDGPDAPAASPARKVVGQVGTTTVAQADADQWHEISFSQSLEDPSVVMGPLTHAGRDPAAMRVRNVTSEGFEFQVDDWDYLDGAHAAETVSWMAVERGRHALADGTVVEAGDARVDHRFAAVDFAAEFDDEPLVFAQAASVNERSAVASRLDGVTARGFSVRLQEEERADQVHKVEDLDWIAFDVSRSASLQGGRTGETVTDKGETIEFAQRAEAPPHFFAAMQSYDGADTAVVRLSALDQAEARIFVEEETSRDRETGHLGESVAWLALTDSLLFA